MARSEAGMAPVQMPEANYFPAIIRGTPRGIQHILALFISNVTPTAIQFGMATLTGGVIVGGMFHLVCNGL